MCSMLPPEGYDETPDFRRGYAIACGIIGVVIILEIIASAWLW